jgi:hypothetical protein
MAFLAALTSQLLPLYRFDGRVHTLLVAPNGFGYAGLSGLFYQSPRRSSANWETQLRTAVDRSLVLPYGSSCVVRGWLVGADPARRWGR